MKALNTICDEMGGFQALSQ